MGDAFENPPPAFPSLLPQCPLTPRERRQARPRAMSALCPRGGSPLLFDYLVGAGEQRGRDREAEGLCRLEVDGQLEF
jgi:hypothetical protein